MAERPKESGTERQRHRESDRVAERNTRRVTKCDSDRERVTERLIGREWQRE